MLTLVTAVCWSGGWLTFIEMLFSSPPPSPLAGLTHKKNSTLISGNGNLNATTMKDFYLCLSLHQFLDELGHVSFSGHSDLRIIHSSSGGVSVGCHGDGFVARGDHLPPWRGGGEH